MRNKNRRERQVNTTRPAKNVPKTKKKRGIFQKNFELLSLCIPALVGYILFAYVPMFGLVMAFKDYKLAKGIWGSKWIGLKNFQFLWSSVDLVRIVRNTVCYSITFIIVGLIFNVFIALLLNEIADNRRALKYYQTTMIFPNFLSWVIVGYITYALFNLEEDEKVLSTRHLPERFFRELLTEQPEIK